MIKSKNNVELKNIEYELKMQLDYDPDSKVIGIIPAVYKKQNTVIMGDVIASELQTTHVKIIWDSK